jgi:hypothetical protein
MSRFFLIHYMSFLNQPKNQSFNFIKLINAFILIVFFGVPNINEYKFSKRSILQFLFVLFISYLLFYVLLKYKILS